MIDQDTVTDVAAFHGHMCPGLAMGIRAAEVALEQIGPHSSDEEVVAITETDMCGVDAVQYLTGCTFGKGNLVHRDYGKNAYTFWRRADGRGVRISARPDTWRRDPEHQALFARARRGELGQEELDAFRLRHDARGRELLELDPDDLFEVREVREPPPRKAAMHESVTCADCGEATMETRIRRYAGREVCPECFDEALAAGW